MSRYAFLILILGSIANATPTADEKVLLMLKKLTEEDQIQKQILNIDKNSSSQAEQELAERSSLYEQKNKEIEMLTSRVQKDLTFEQKLPRAIGYSTIGEHTTAIIDFSGRKFRLGLNDIMAGWKVVSILDNCVEMKNRDGYSFKSYFDTKQQQQ